MRCFKLQCLLVLFKIIDLERKNTVVNFFHMHHNHKVATVHTRESRSFDRGQFRPWFLEIKKYFTPFFSTFLKRLKINSNSLPTYLTKGEVAPPFWTYQ